MLSFISIPAKAVDTCTPEIIESGGYITLQFLNTGTCTFSAPSGITVMQGLVVGGGGGGGTDMGGGGGAGGYLDFETLTVSSQTLTITVGAGGIGAAPDTNTAGLSGADTLISGTGILLTALGGAGGASLTFSNSAPARIGGGSGGGASGGEFTFFDTSSRESQTAQSQTPSLSSIGGNQYGNNGSPKFGDSWNPGGGGGAGSAGSTNPGNGGVGYPNSILGTMHRWAGGGGGSGNDSDGGNGGNGGGGAGGKWGRSSTATGGAGFNSGSASSDGNAGGNGGANTGGGGGGSAWGGFGNGNTKGGNGGSGIVVLKYLAPAPGAATRVKLSRASVGTERRAAFATQPQIGFRDANYNTITTSSPLVTASISAGGTLTGTTTASASSGVATFNDLGVDGDVGSTYTITYSAPGLTSVSQSITLTGTSCDGVSFACQPGDISPSGGVIFYAPAEPFSCGADFTSLCTYLEAAPKNWKPGGVNDPGHYFKPDDVNVPGIANESTPNLSANQIGLGHKNSIILSAFDTNTANAAVASRAYNGGGNNDWYLPTLAELQLLCQFSHGQVPALGASCDYSTPINTRVPSPYTFLNNAYLSSSQSSTNWHQNFVANAVGPGEHNTWEYWSTNFPTRPIRAFAANVTASKIAITQNPVGAERTRAFTTQPQITFQSVNGVRDLSASDTVTATVSAGGTLVGTTTARATQGRATFSDLGIDGTVGTAYTITFTAAGLTIATTTVTPTPRVVSDAAIGGVTAPVSGATPVTAVTFTNGYTGTVTWSGAPSRFAASTTYTATITLTASAGHTLTGVTANFFTVSGATSVNHSANSGSITAVFPETAIAAPEFSISSSSESVTVDTAMTGYTITSTGGTIASYSITPAITNTPGLSFNTATGEISGTPTTVALARTYTITAINVTTPNATRTFTITVVPPPPSATIGTTSFTTAAASNLNLALADFDQTQSYQVTVKFVNASTNVEVTNGTLTATQGSTSLISGYTSFSDTKLGFTGTYAAISSALSSVTWNPASTTNGISIRIGISSAPATNEFYDANSGHYYRFVATPTAWLDARTAAERTYLYGLQGYLAEINSEAENTFIAKETSAANIWIGAREDSATALNYYGRSYNGSVGQRWTWNGAAQSPLPVGTGEIAQSNLAAYSGWSQSEPNNDTRPRVVNNETIAGLDCAVTNWRTRGLWNDLPCGHGYGYLIEFGGRVSQVSTASSATLTETLTAANPVPYTITYNPNNGNSTPTQASRTRGQIFNLANAITRSPSGGTSYQFAGWESGSNTYSAGETITVGSANLTFTAVWIQLYEVTYISNGGTFAGSETSKDADCASDVCSLNQVITLNEDPTRQGYLFDGWRDQGSNIVSDSDPAMAGIQTSVTSTRYIFNAMWSLINYTVTYVSSGSMAPTQSALNAGQTFTVGAEVTKTGFRFEGWSDGAQIYWTNEDYQVQSSNVTLTAQWRAIYTVTYSEGSGSGTPPVDESIFLQGNTFEVEVATGLSKSGATFSGWSDGANIFQPGVRYTIATSNVTLTARWGTESNSSNVVAAPAAALRAVTSPKITRDSTHYICISGRFLFVRNGSATEAPKLSLQKFSLIQDGKVVESIESAQSEIKFEIKSSYLNSTMSCSVQVGQESALSSFSSLSSKVIAEANEIRKAAQRIADSQFYRDRTAALAKRANEFKRIDQSKISNAVAAKSTATKLWRMEIQKATADRDAAREAAQEEYLKTLEKSGISIYPQEVKTVVKSTPSPTPTTNPQPVAQMEKVGTVYMASGSYFLDDATKESLRAVAKKINAGDAKSILVYGHADSRGGVDNTALSRNRARAVAAFIRPLLNTKKIAVGWFSSKRPVAAGTTEADLALNRRVEIYAR